MKRTVFALFFAMFISAGSIAASAACASATATATSAAEDIKRSAELAPADVKAASSEAAIKGAVNELFPAVPRTPSPDAAHMKAQSAAQRAEAQLIPLLQEPLNQGGPFPIQLRRIIAGYWPTIVTVKVVNKIDAEAAFWFDLPTKVEVRLPWHARQLNSGESEDVALSDGDEQAIDLAFTHPKNPHDTRTMRVNLQLRNIACKPRIVEIIEDVDKNPPTAGLPRHKIAARLQMPGARSAFMNDLSFGYDNPVPPLPTFLNGSAGSAFYEQ